MARLTLLANAALVACISAAVPSVLLRNAATPGMSMPAIGLGTGGYGAAKAAYNAYPECWMEIAGCGNYTVEAVKLWLAAGGVRLDNADSYDTQVSVGIAMAQSGLPRENIFLLQKTGNWNTMGYNDTLLQMELILEQMNLTYVDLLLNHWPTSPATGTIDPVCDPDLPVYSAKQCRLNTWKALVEIFQSGRARAIGVANYNATHLQEIIDAGMILPSVNQIPFNPYRSSSQADTIAFNTAHNIVTIAYSPLGIPDWHAFPTPQMPSATILQDPVVQQIASAHGATPAQVIIAWEWSQGIPCNPRSMNVTHMKENLAAYSITLSQAEIAALSSRPQDLCSFDASFYECYDPTGQHVAQPPPRM